MFRNFRLEAVSCQISSYIAYYNSLKELRINLEDYLQNMAILLPEWDMRFIGRRVDELAKRRRT